MRSKKQIVSLILVWIMVVALSPIGHFEKLRADTTDLMTPTLAEDGTLSWDPSIRDVYFDVDGENTHYSIMGGTSYNLNDYFEEYSYRTCDTKIELYGKVGTEYQLMWSGTFHYEAKYGILDTPKNVVLTEDYVLHWDPVDNATSYRVYILDRQGNMHINDRGTISGKSELFVGHIFDYTFPHDCQLGVVAMSSKGYQKSDLAKSAVYHVTRADKRITNVKFSKDGMMTWDELEGATYYKIGIGINDKKASFTCSTTSVAIDEKIRSALPDGGAGFYTVTIQAFDDEKALSYIWEGEHDIDVVFYDLFIYGEQITSVNLDVFGDGSVVFEPQTSTLRFSCESLNELDYIGDGIEWDGKAPFVNTGMDLTITGTLIIPSGYWVTFKIFESLGKLTFVDFNFTIGGSQTRIIEAANIEFVSGTYDIVGYSNNPIRVYHDIVFRNGITSFSVSVDGTSAILVDHGKITLEGLLITCPQNGTISADGKRFLQEDGETDAPWVILKPDPNYVPPTPEPGPTTPEPGPTTPEPGPSTPAPDPTNPNPDPSNPQPGTPDPAKDPSFEDFVERLYTVALGRASEAEGKAFWVDQVVNKGFTGADCARFFLLDAPEFLGRGLTDDEFVEILYLTFFDRASEPDGKAYWLGRLASGSPKADVVNDFIESTEWCNVCATYGVKSGAKWHKATIASKNAIKFATRLYTCCLARDPEADGLNYWSLALTNLEATGYQAASLFFESPEFLGFNTSNEEYLKRLYTTFMGREADADGFAYWLGLLNGGTSRTDAMKAFASCPEFQEICNQYGIERGEI